MKPKILIVAHRWPPRSGGTENTAFLYAKALSKKFRVTVFTSSEKNYENICPKKVKLVEGKSKPWLYDLFGIPQPIFHPGEIEKLKKEAMENDVIIINDRYYLSSIFAFQFAKEFEKKVILILQTPTLKYNGIFSLFYKINNSFGKKILNESDCIFAVSKETGFDVLKHYGLKKEFEVLYSPVNFAEFKKKLKKFEKFTVLFVARFVEKKGVELLPKIAKKLEGKNIQIIAIGNGPLLKKTVEEAKNLQNIKFLGEIACRKKLLHYYKKSHVLLVASRHGEGFPMAISEAMAAGLPVVSTKGGTFLEVFEKNIGYLCNCNDIACIAESILKLKNGKMDYFEKSKNCVKFSKQKFDLDKNAEKLEKAIKKIAG